MSNKLGLNLTLQQRALLCESTFSFECWLGSLIGFNLIPFLIFDNSSCLLSVCEVFGLSDDTRSSFGSFRSFVIEFDLSTQFEANKYELEVGEGGGGGGGGVGDCGVVGDCIWDIISGKILIFN